MGLIYKFQEGGKADLSKVKLNFAKSTIEAQDKLDREKSKENSKTRDRIQYYQKQGLNLKEAQNKVLVEQHNKYQGEFKEYKPQGAISKGLEIAGNPMNAAKQKLKYGRVPDHFSQNSEESIASPLSVLDMGYQGLTAIGKAAGSINAVYNASKDLKEGNYLSAALNAIDIIPGSVTELNIARSKNLPALYKYNPSANKTAEEYLLKKGKDLGYKRPTLIYHGSPFKDLKLNSQESILPKTFERDKAGTFFTSEKKNTDPFRFHHKHTPQDIMVKVNLYKFEKEMQENPKLEKLLMKRGYSKSTPEEFKIGEKLYTNYGEVYTALTDANKLTKLGHLPNKTNSYAKNIQDAAPKADIYLLDKENFIQADKPHFIKGFNKLR